MRTLAFGVGLAVLAGALPGAASDGVWTRGRQYDTGKGPTVALLGTTVVEVHMSETTDTLWFHVGTVPKR